MDFNTLKAFFYRPAFFREQKFSGSASIRFYSLTMLVVVGLTLVMVLPGFLRVVDLIRSGEWQRQQMITRDLFPEKLVLTLEQGTLSTNQSAPVEVRVPEAWQKMGCAMEDACREAEIPLNFLVIDTTASVTPQAIEDRETLVLLGQHEMGVWNPERGETRIFNLREMELTEKLTITKAVFDQWVERGSDFLKIVFYIVGAVIPFAIYFGMWIGYLIYSLLGTLIVWLAAHLRGHQLTYGRAYLSTLYLLPTPFLVSFLMHLADSRIPFVFSLVLFLAALVNFPKLSVPMVTPMTSSPGHQLPETTKEPASGKQTVSESSDSVYQDILSEIPQQKG
jgi:hypothetical protein